MNLIVFGATGKTGSLVVEQALAKGHIVTVLVRDPSKVKATNVKVVTGDATKPSDVLKAMRGQQAAIDSIGGTTPYKATKLERTSAQNIVAAMKAENVRRLIVVSMMGLGESYSQAPFWYKYLLMPTFLHGSTKDKAAMEAVVKSSGLSYLIARPPILVEGPATGKIKILENGEIGHKITRADLASFLVDQLDTDLYLGRPVTVVNR